MLLYGAGGHAKVVLDCLMEQGVSINGIFDDKSDLVSLNGYDVLGKYDEHSFEEDQVIITIGDNTTRKNLVQKIKHKFGKIAHPSAIMSKYVQIGEGSVVFHGCILQTGVRIGKHCIINTGASLDHDVTVGDFAHISPKVTLCDVVEIGEGTHIGAGATILPKITVGKWCVVGAGAVITQNLPDYSLVVGVPGKIIRRTDDQ